MWSDLQFNTLLFLTSKGSANGHKTGRELQCLSQQVEAVSARDCEAVLASPLNEVRQDISDHYYYYGYPGKYYSKYYRPVKA